MSEETLDGFLDGLASKAATPGGGAVAGLSGALAAALSHMVAALTVGKKKYADVGPEFEAAMPEMERVRARFRRLMDEDATAFGGVMAAYGLPKADEEEKAARRAAIAAATVDAAEVPMQTLELCRDILPSIRLAAEKGNRNVVSDAGIAALCVTCAARSAAMNVRINLNGLTGDARETLASRLDSVLGPVLEEAEALASMVDAELAS